MCRPLGDSSRSCFALPPNAASNIQGLGSSRHWAMHITWERGATSAPIPRVRKVRLGGVRAKGLTSSRVFGWCRGSGRAGASILRLMPLAGDRAPGGGGEDQHRTGYHCLHPTRTSALPPRTVLDIQSGASDVWLSSWGWASPASKGQMVLI